MLRLSDEVVHLPGIVLVIEQHPRAFEAAHVGVATGADGAVFPGKLAGDPRRHPHVECGAIRLASGADQRGQVLALDAAGNLHAGQTEQGGQDVRRGEWGGDRAPAGCRHTQQERHLRRLAPGDLLGARRYAVRSEHLAVVGGEDEDGVVGQAGLGQRGQQVADAAVERGAMGVVALRLLPRLGLQGVGNIGRQLDLLRRIERLELGRRGLVREMGDAVGDEQDEGLPGPRAVTEVLPGRPRSGRRRRSRPRTASRRSRPRSSASGCSCGRTPPPSSSPTPAAARAG